MNNKTNRQSTDCLELIKAAQSVIDNWETGDLAFAVRELSEALQATLKARGETQKEAK